ncbi:MAG: ribosome silencing factor [Alphaproteobacteria bacterium]|nr:MAG: ribosome silencing factor [Alphaproteobacteria bacterium]
MEDGLLSDLARAGETKPALPVSGVDGVTGIESAEMLSLVLDSLSEDKAEDIVQIDLRGRSSVADFMVIASGRSTRQVAAIAEHLMERVKQRTGLRPRAEGLEAADWVLIDTGDVVVHVFRPEVREFYQLEKMWMPRNEALTRAVGSA